MKNMMKKLSMFLFALVTVFATVVAPLNAEETPTAPDPTKDVSLTIHKVATKSTSTAVGTGLELTLDDIKTITGDSEAHWLKGAEFTLYEVDPSYEVKASDTVDTLKSQLSGVEYVGVTDANGVINWNTTDDGLAQGYYILVETDTPIGYQKAADSIITLPYGYTSATGTTQFNYDVHVYPKNVTGVTKEVDSSSNPSLSHGVGDIIKYNISAQVLVNLTDGTDYGYFKMTDVLDERLTYSNTSDVVTGTTESGASVTLVKGTDYTVTYTAATNTIVLELTSTGMDKCGYDAADPIKKITWSFETEINEKVLTNGKQIDNDATLEFENYDGSEQDKIVTPEVTIIITRLDIYKYVDNPDDATDLTNALAGAKFKLSNSKNSNSYLCTDGIYRTDAELTTYNAANPTTPESHVEVTTDADGKASFIGIPLTFANPATPTQAELTVYLTETFAPAGMVKPLHGWEIVLKPDTTTYAGYTYYYEGINVANQEIGNPPPPETPETPTFPLPSTGGIGTYILQIIGGVLMVIAAVVLVIMFKKKEKNSLVS